jgi:hypothetical protein
MMLCTACVFLFNENVRSGTIQRDMSAIRRGGARSLRYSFLKAQTALEELLNSLSSTSNSSPNRSVSRSSSNETSQTGKEGGGLAMALQKFQDRYQVKLVSCRKHIPIAIAQPLSIYCLQTIGVQAPLTFTMWMAGTSVHIADLTSETQDVVKSCVLPSSQGMPWRQH